VIQEWASTLDHFEEVLFNGPFAQGRVVVEVADELATQCPHIIDVFLDGLWRQVRRGKIFQERTEQGQ
jgi:hypothetical protein